MYAPLTQLPFDEFSSIIEYSKYACIFVELNAPKVKIGQHMLFVHDVSISNQKHNYHKER